MTQQVLEYLKYHKNNALMWEIDTHLDAAVYYADKHHLDIEQRYWLSFLTAICETTPTSLYLFHHFPALKTTNPEHIADFCKRRKGAMAFQYDVRWILYSIGDVVASYKQIIGNMRQADVLPRLAVGNTQEERFKTFCQRFRCFKFGNYVLMLYTELLHYLCGIDFEASIDPADNHSVRSGLVYACGYEDFIECVKKGSKPTSTENNLLRAELAEIRAEVQKLNILPRHKRMWAIETTLCTYNKTKHGKRYLGFYKNRQEREIKRLVEYTRAIGENYDWSELIEYHNNWGKWNNNYLL